MVGLKWTIELWTSEKMKDRQEDWLETEAWCWKSLRNQHWEKSKLCDGMTMWKKDVYGGIMRFLSVLSCPSVEMQAVWVNSVFCQ